MLPDEIEIDAEGPDSAPNAKPFPLICAAELTANTREMLNIPAGQFESLLGAKTPLPKPDYHAIRLILALLKHGQRQLHSPQQFCELPQTVNMELGDYDRSFGVFMTTAPLARRLEIFLIRSHWASLRSVL